MARFRLTRIQVAKLAAGECPGIGGKGDPPVDRGEIIRIAPNLTLTVLRVDTFAESWRLHYIVTDKRDPVRLLRRTPPVVAPKSEDAPTPEALHRSAQESSYTAGGANTVHGAGEAVDEETQRRFTRESREGFRAHLDRERREREARSLDTRLRLVQELAAERGVDLSRKLASIEARIAAAEREVGREET